MFYTFCSSILPLVNLYILKLLVDAVTAAVNHQATLYDDSISILNFHFSIVHCLAFYCCIILINRLISALSAVNNDVLTQRLIDYINNIIQNQSVRLDMSFFDNPEYHDTFHRAQQEAAFRPIRIVESMVQLFGSLISLVGVAAMLIVYSWQVVAFMSVAVIPSFVVRLYKSRRIYSFRRETTQESRQAIYYGQLLSNRSYAQEVRAFALDGYFRDRYVEIRHRLVEKLLRISRRLALYDMMASVFETAALLVVILLLIRPVVAGLFTIGTFVMLFEAFRRAQGFLEGMVGGVSGLYEHKLFIKNLFEFLELEPEIKSPASPRPFPARVESVEFDDITFSYPGLNRPVLSHFTMRARYGEVTHLTGENGFGKTTLLKLLMRLYDPQKGAVRINGVDIREYDLGELRHNISTIFQEHVHFFFTARENIIFGDIKNGEDARRLADALRMADAEEVCSRLSKGLDTQLGRQFNGEELSMGQWQRLSLARQLYSQAPILLFDEPTAWMDAQAREEFGRTVEALKGNHLIILVTH